MILSISETFDKWFYQRLETIQCNTVLSITGTVRGTIKL